VQVLSSKLKTESLSAHSDQARYLETEAGNRAQPDLYMLRTLALTGSPHDENRASKSNLSLGRRNQ